MSTIRTRANSETVISTARHWIEQVFQVYPLPAQFGDIVVEGRSHRIQTRFLGEASVKIDSTFTQASFFELAEFELVVDTEPIQANGEMGLSPRSTRHGKVIRYDVVFCLETHRQLLPATYYLFPQQAIVEALNDANLLQIIVSFHLPRGGVSGISDRSSSLDGFAISSNSTLGRFPQRRFTDPAVSTRQASDCHVINLSLTGVSKSLYVGLKHTVCEFESAYGKMMELMKVHTHHMSHQVKVGSPSLSVGVLSHKQYLDSWSSEEDMDDKEKVEDFAQPMPIIKEKSKPNQNTTKKCLYCGSKSTPMWRRGPQGAGTLCNACGVKWKHGKILCNNSEDKSKDKKNDKKRKKSISTTKKEKRLKSDYFEQEYVIPEKQSENWSSSSHSVSDAYSPLESSESTPPLLDRRRHTVSIVDQISFTDASFAMSAGVDAVEAAAVLTLLKRS
ncbi:hypothetical protein K501DRAFT_335972 [Backusella circina FSU 941]|nr:hypothetical protein K501DRAFT_335972 [Backusella circina FSU 941]